MRQTILIALCAIMLAGCKPTPELNASTRVYDDAEPAVVASNDGPDDDVSEQASNGSSAFSAENIDTGISVLSGALGVLGGVAAMNNAVTSANAARAASAGVAATGIAAGQGYSQVGAFNECQQLYTAAGQSALAAECARRASNMSSLR